MAKTTANISIDADTKQKAQALFAELGMDLSTAVTVFFRQAIREHSIPFEITADIPNAETREAIAEVQRMKKNPSLGKAYDDVDSMFEELLA